MTSRPSLVRSIPFWVLIVGSLALTGVGAWLVLDHLGRIESGIRSQTAEGAIAVYIGPPAATAGAVVLGAGLVGLLLALTLAALRSLLPAGDVVETVEWTEEDTAADDVLSPAAGPTTTAEPFATTAAPAASAAPAAPVIAEDPDVETPSDAPPPRGARD
ncbi:dinucleotide-utilizing enzyme [Microbacterium lushaniae]|nr:dinucleotide-utilizing enzyme [Microbacterium lushaniae]KAA9151939.1 dinucleotide-utilizing enzyme [Microbacterium lushaniae]